MENFHGQNKKDGLALPPLPIYSSSQNHIFFYLTLTPEQMYDLLNRLNGTFYPRAVSLLQQYYEDLKKGEYAKCAKHLYFMTSLIPEDGVGYDGYHVASTGYGLYRNQEYAKCRECNGLDKKCPQYMHLDKEIHNTLVRMLETKLEVIKKNGLIQPKDDL
ncbi:MAG: hypothetical protein GXN99_03285 [Candidatus Nanohaloarchaeota archaeon]|nr:hypothetical protein [Candidatus Nanohaloarchaeota archaeon]